MRPGTAALPGGFFVRFAPAVRFAVESFAALRRDRDHSPCMEPNADSPAQDRRAFLTKASAVVIGGSLVVAPVVAGLCVVFDPLRRKTEAGASVLVATLTSLPEDGEPRKFSVLATRVDA
jgi:hypothetical protein